MWFNQPNDEWLAVTKSCSKSGLVYLIEMLQCIYSVPREQMLTYAKEAKDHGRFSDSIRRFNREREDPELREMRRLEKKLKSIKAKRARKETA
jgi:hypothetical protein